jgi:hypothetical protein
MRQQKVVDENGFMFSEKDLDEHPCGVSAKTVWSNWSLWTRNFGSKLNRCWDPWKTSFSSNNNKERLFESITLCQLIGSSERGGANFFREAKRILNNSCVQEKV